MCGNLCQLLRTAQAAFFGIGQLWPADLGENVGMSKRCRNETSSPPATTQTPETGLIIWEATIIWGIAIIYPLTSSIAGQSHPNFIENLVDEELPDSP